MGLPTRALVVARGPFRLGPRRVLPLDGRQQVARREVRIGSSWAPVAQAAVAQRVPGSGPVAPATTIIIILVANDGRAIAIMPPDGINFGAHSGRVQLCRRSELRSCATTAADCHLLAAAAVPPCTWPHQARPPARPPARVGVNRWLRRAGPRRALCAKGVHSKWPPN